MNNKMDEAYVAQLLKQLEELKKKKAHKEKKLQKLKGSSVKDLKRERSSRISNTSIEKEPDQKNNRAPLIKLDKSIPGEKSRRRKSSDSISDLKHEKDCDSNFNDDKEKSINVKFHSFSLENHKFIKDSKNNFDTNTKNSMNAVDEQQCVINHNTNETAVDCLKTISDLNNSIKYKCETSEDDVFLNPVNSEIKTNCKKSENHNLPVLNKLSCSEEKSPIVENITEYVGENMCKNDDVIHSIKKPSSSTFENSKIVNDVKEVLDDAAEKVKQTNLPDDLALASDNTEMSTKHDSSEGEKKSLNDSSKSLPSKKGKSSDILEDSLNCNMSFFMSADLFANDDDDKKDLNKNLNGNQLRVTTDECYLPIEGDSKANCTKLPDSSHPHLSINGYKNNVDVFNFPKFSTPTEGNTQVDDDMPDLIEKSPEIINSRKRNSSLNKGFNNFLPSTSKCESPLLNFVLEKRLSTVLDAHYESPKKTISKIKISASDIQDHSSEDVSNGNTYKKRKLFSEPNCTPVSSELKSEHKKTVPDSDSDIVPCKLYRTSVDFDPEMKYDGFDNVSPFDSGSNSCDSLKNIDPPATLAKNSCGDISSQISKTVDSLVSKVCDGASYQKLLNIESINKNEERCVEKSEESKMDSEVLVVPETEGLGLYFVKDTEEFLETSTLSESMENFPVKENVLNVSSQSKLESPVVNNIVSAIKSSRSFQSIHQENKIEHDVRIDDGNCLASTPKKVDEQISNDAALAFDNSLGLDTSFLEDDTQDLGTFKQVPYMNDVNVDKRDVPHEIKTNTESNLKFICSLSGSDNDPVVNVEIIIFNDVKYGILQHKTCLCVWRQERNMHWIKIFNHEIEDMLSLVKITISMDDDCLVIIMLLNNEEQYCLQFLIFERDARVIKLMENTHWLEERSEVSEDSILLCGLSGLMFAIAQNKEKPEVSIHAFISLRENPRLMTAVLGTTETPLCSLCKIDKLPNALMGISDSKLYVWHILEARLVTAVSLHPHDYLPIKECFWATVEYGLIYLLTTCEEDRNHHICQLLAANLATGFCQTAMTYSTLPSTNKVKRIIKAGYEEPFLVVAHSEGAFIWSVMEEFCCAALPSTSNITSISISRDFDNWGLLAVGSKTGLVNCYSLH